MTTTPGLSAWLVCQSFGAVPSNRVLMEAFHELTQGVRDLRVLAIHNDRLTADEQQLQQEHLAVACSLLEGLSSATPLEQSLLRPQLDLAISWLSATHAS